MKLKPFYKIGMLLLCATSIIPLTACDYLNPQTEQTIISTYKVNVVVPMGENSTSLNLTIQSGNSVNLNELIPEIEGYEFSGWYLDDAYMFKISNPEEYTPAENVSVYAKLVLAGFSTPEDLANKFKEFEKAVTFTSATKDFSYTMAMDGETGTGLLYDSTNKTMTGGIISMFAGGFSNRRLESSYWQNDTAYISYKNIETEEITYDGFELPLSKIQKETNFYASTIFANIEGAKLSPTSTGYIIECNVLETKEENITIDAVTLEYKDSQYIITVDNGTETIQLIYSNEVEDIIIPTEMKEEIDDYLIFDQNEALEDFVNFVSFNANSDYVIREKNNSESIIYFSYDSDNKIADGSLLTTSYGEIVKKSDDTSYPIWTYWSEGQNICTTKHDWEKGVYLNYYDADTIEKETLNANILSSLFLNNTISDLSIISYTFEDKEHYSLILQNGTSASTRVKLNRSLDLFTITQVSSDTEYEIKKTESVSLSLPSDFLTETTDIITRYETKNIENALNYKFTLSASNSCTVKDNTSNGGSYSRTGDANGGIYFLLTYNIDEYNTATISNLTSGLAYTKFQETMYSGRDAITSEGMSGSESSSGSISGSGSSGNNGSTATTTSFSGNGSIIASNIAFQATLDLKSQYYIKGKLETKTTTKILTITGSYTENYSIFNGKLTDRISYNLKCDGLEIKTSVDRTADVSGTYRVWSQSNAERTIVDDINFDFDNISATSSLSSTSTVSDYFLSTGSKFSIVRSVSSSERTSNNTIILDRKEVQ